MLVNAFKYKQWANQEMVNFGLKQIDKLSPNDATFFIRILNHTAVVDSLFISRIKGVSEYFSADNTLETPSLTELSQFMSENDAWLVDYCTFATSQELAREIVFQFTDGEVGRLTVEEILLHLLTHGSNHRGMASRVLLENGLERPKDTFTRFLHQVEPNRRMNIGTGC